MEKKRFKMFIGITLIIILLSLCGFYIFKKLNENKEHIAFNEYTPQEEISDDNFMKTFVKLYFKEISSNNLRAETRSIDVKDLITDPYTCLVNLLIEGPTDETLVKTIPESTILNNASINGDTLTLDFSNNFIENQVDNIELQNATIYSLVNTLTELTEVNSIKILIDGKENCSFNNNGISFNKPFVKLD